jgi:glutamate-ammonia-ligase adenylyltransferase
MTGSLAERITRAPHAHDPAQAAGIAGLIPDLTETGHDLLEGAAGCSPYLAGLMRREADWLARAMQASPEDSFAEILAAMDQTSDGTLAFRLRRAKRQAALLIALADLGGVWQLEAVTGALTALADRSVQLALSALSRRSLRAANSPAARPAICPRPQACLCWPWARWVRAS